MKQPSDPESKAKLLAQTAEALGLEIAPDELAALAVQLCALAELEETELREQPPILIMDAGWHD